MDDNDTKEVDITVPPLTYAENKPKNLELNDKELDSLAIFLSKRLKTGNKSNKKAFLLGIGLVAGVIPWIPTLLFIFNNDFRFIVLLLTKYFLGSSQ